MSDTNNTTSSSSSSSCTVIHTGPAGTQRAPLFLLHDGGGTIFHYFLLKPLNRAVYGIQNSRVQPGQEWEGGIPEMAAEYLDAIKKVVQRRPILVGGTFLFVYPLLARTPRTGGQVQHLHLRGFVILYLC
jgi:hypothetical protein